MAEAGGYLKKIGGMVVRVDNGDPVYFVQPAGSEKGYLITLTVDIATKFVTAAAANQAVMFSNGLCFSFNDGDDTGNGSVPPAAAVTAGAGGAGAGAGAGAGSGPRAGAGGSNSSGAGAGIGAAAGSSGLAAASSPDEARTTTAATDVGGADSSAAADVGPALTTSGAPTSVGSAAPTRTDSANGVEATPTALSTDGTERKPRGLSLDDMAADAEVPVHSTGPCVPEPAPLEHMTSEDSLGEALALSLSLQQGASSGGNETK